MRKRRSSRTEGSCALSTTARAASGRREPWFEEYLPAVTETSPNVPTSRRPLDGIRVLDLSRVLSGPSCGKALADLGADVIKVEPPEGDLTRTAQPRVGGLPAYFAQQNCGKRCVSVDLRLEAGRDLVAALASASDVVLENFRPGVLDRLGLGYAAVQAHNPEGRVLLDHGLRTGRSDGATTGVCAGDARGARFHGVRRPAVRDGRRGPRRSRTRICTRVSRRRSGSSPRSSNAMQPASASTSTSRWPR